MTRNLRGEHVRFPFGRRKLKGIVITHTRGTRWLISSRQLPAEYTRMNGTRRIVLDRSQFTLMGKMS